jgi:hypothetical protein
MTQSKDFQKASEAAAAETDRDLAEEAERFQPPTWDEVRRMLPEPQDQQELAQLMEILQGDTAHNEKVAALLHNINGVAGAVVKVLGRFK